MMIEDGDDIEGWSSLQTPPFPRWMSEWHDFIRFGSSVGRAGQNRLEHRMDLPRKKPSYSAHTLIIVIIVTKICSNSDDDDDGDQNDAMTMWWWWWWWKQQAHHGKRKRSHLPILDDDGDDDDGVDDGGVALKEKNKGFHLSRLVPTAESSLLPTCSTV